MQNPVSPAEGAIRTGGRGEEGQRCVLVSVYSRVRRAVPGAEPSRVGTQISKQLSAIWLRCSSSFEQICFSCWDATCACRRVHALVHADRAYEVCSKWKFKVTSCLNRSHRNTPVSVCSTDNGLFLCHIAT